MFMSFIIQTNKLIIIKYYYVNNTQINNFKKSLEIKLPDKTKFLLSPVYQVKTVNQE